MRRMLSALGAAALLATVGAGVASADPINGNSRYLTVNCGGEILDLVTNQGTVAHVVGDSRVLVMQGLTQDGVWLLPISNGQSKAGLVECVYTQLFHGHQYVIYVNITGQ